MTDTDSIVYTPLTNNILYQLCKTINTINDIFLDPDEEFIFVCLKNNIEYDEPTLCSHLKIFVKDNTTIHIVPILNDCTVAPHLGREILISNYSTNDLILNITMLFFIMTYLYKCKIDIYCNVPFSGISTLQYINFEHLICYTNNKSLAKQYIYSFARFITKYVL